MKPWVLLLALAVSARAAGLTAIMGAYPPELTALRAEFEHGQGSFRRAEIRGITFDEGRTDGHPVLIFMAGSSLVNAAYQLQIALDRFDIERVLFAGVAGGVDPELRVGDVVVPERWAYHAEAAYLNPDGHGGYIVPAYLAPKLPNFGMIFPDSVEGVREGERREPHPFFAADPELLQLARKALAGMPEIRRGGHAIRTSVGGTGVSGPVFVDNAEYREWIQRVWHARCADMESTAYAQVCWANRKPFLIVRGLSDLAGGQKAPNPINDNELPVSAIAARCLRAILDVMP